MRADCRAAFLTIIIFTKQKELHDIRNSPQITAPAAECSSGISIKVNRDTGNTDGRTPFGTDAFFIIQRSGKKSKKEKL